MVTILIYYFGRIHGHFSNTILPFENRSQKNNCFLQATAFFRWALASVTAPIREI